MSSLGLTPIGKKVLDAVRAHISTHDVSPSYDEIETATGVRKCRIGAVLRRLAESGHLAWTPRRKRTIALPGDRAVIPIVLAPDAELALRMRAEAARQSPEQLAGRLIRVGLGLGETP